MYSEDYDDEEEVEQTSGSFLVNFYNNNKVLVWIFLGIIIFIILMSLLTKGGSNKTSKPKDYSVIIYQEGTVNVSIGTSQTLLATVKDNPTATIIWSTEDEKIAKVDNGNVVGVDYGKTKVTATYIADDDNKYSESRDVVVADGDPNTRLTNVAFKDGDSLSLDNSKITGEIIEKIKKLESNIVLDINANENPIISKELYSLRKSWKIYILLVKVKQVLL